VSDMLPIKNTENAPKHQQESVLLKSEESNCSGQIIRSVKAITTQCLPLRTECAPSATGLTEESASTLTTATTQATSEGFYAHHATQVSDSSKITLTDLQERLNTYGKLDPWVVWCHLNSEQDALEKAFGPLAISIHGSLSDDEKIMRHNAWLRGDAPVLIVKPSMFAHGLNWQHCSNCVFVGLNDSFEQVYQAVRRFWRFGQTKPVNVHFIASEMEGATVSNLRRKEADADRMAAAMVMHMADLSSAEVRGSVRDRPDYNPTIPMKIPAWVGECVA